MSPLRRLLLSLVLVCAAPLPLIAQEVPRSIDEVPVSEEFILRSWEMGSEMPSNSIASIAQTPDGYLWVASSLGLVRFDGVKFTPVAREIPGQEKLTSATAVFVSRKGDLWVGTPWGSVARLSADRWEWIVGKGAAPGPEAAITSIAEDASGAIWIAYLKGIRVARWYQGALQVFSPRESIQGIEANVLSDSEGRLWSFTREAYGVFDGKRFHRIDRPRGGDRPVLASLKDGGVLMVCGSEMFRLEASGGMEKLAELPWREANPEVSCLFVDHSGDAWVGTRRAGLFRFHHGVWQRVPTSHSYISVISEDREGNLWVGTDGGGLDRIEPRSFFLHQTKDGLSDEQTVSLCEESTGRIWIAGRTGAPVRAVDDSNRKFVAPEGWPKALGVLAMCADPDGKIWIAARGVWTWTEGHYQLSIREQVTAMLMDRQKNLWAATINGPLILRDPEHSLRKLPTENGLSQVRSLALDSAGCLWVGTGQGRLFRSENGQLLPIDLSTPQDAEIGVRFIVPDGPRTVWIGMGTWGLCRWKEGKVQYLPRWTEHPAQDFQAMAIDQDGDYWIGTGGGLLRVPRGEMEAALEGKTPAPRYVTYGQDDGLPSMEFGLGFRGSGIRTRNGHLWFSTFRGALEIAPEKLRKTVAPLPLIIEEMRVGSNTVHRKGGQPGKLVLAPHPGPVQIRFTLPQLRGSDQVEFQYRLVGLRDEWVSSERRRSVTFESLPAGNYRFEVAASGEGDPLYQNVATLVFSVSAAWWETGVFRICAGMVACVITAAVARKLVKRRMKARIRSLEQANALERERTRIARDMHDEVGASLTQISIASRLAKHQLSEEASEHIEEIHAIARRTAAALDEIVWAVNPRNDTLPALIDYLGEYSVRFLASAGIGAKPEIPVDVPPVPVEAHVRHHLFLAVKEALANIVKHAGAAEVRLAVELESQRLRISIHDDGRGFAPGKTGAGADGLQNMRERMAELGGECQVESRPGEGTQVVFTLTLPPNPTRN